MAISRHAASVRNASRSLLAEAGCQELAPAARASTEKFSRRGNNVAAKDNQGLQAIVIVLALLVVGLAVGLFLINNAKKTATARAEQAETSAQNASSAERKAQEEANN